MNGSPEKAYLRVINDGILIFAELAELAGTHLAIAAIKLRVFGLGMSQARCEGTSRGNKCMRRSEVGAGKIESRAKSS